MGEAVWMTKPAPCAGASRLPVGAMNGGAHAVPAFSRVTITQPPRKPLPPVTQIGYQPLGLSQ